MPVPPPPSPRLWARGRLTRRAGRHRQGSQDKGSETHSGRGVRVWVGGRAAGGRREGERGALGERRGGVRICVCGGASWGGGVRARPPRPDAMNRAKEWLRMAGGGAGVRGGGGGDKRSGYKRSGYPYRKGGRRGRKKTRVRARGEARRRVAHLFFFFFFSFFLRPSLRGARGRGSTGPSNARAPLRGLSCPTPGLGLGLGLG